MHSSRGWLKGLVSRALEPGLALRVYALELKLDFQYELIVRLIDLVHERDREHELKDKARDMSDRELHRFVQYLADKTASTFRVHSKDIAKLVALTTGKPTQELIDMKATGVWKQPTKP